MPVIQVWLGVQVMTDWATENEHLPIGTPCVHFFPLNPQSIFPSAWDTTTTVAVPNSQRPSPARKCHGDLGRTKRVTSRRGRGTCMGRQNETTKVQRRSQFPVCNKIWREEKVTLTHINMTFLTSALSKKSFDHQKRVSWAGRRAWYVQSLKWFQLISIKTIVKVRE